MNDKEAQNFLDWIWGRMKQELELDKALEKMERYKRIHLENEIFYKLSEWYE